MLLVPAALSLLLAVAPLEAWTLERVASEAVARSPEVAAARAEEEGAEGVRAADGRLLRNNPSLEVAVVSDALTGAQGEQRAEVVLSQMLEVAGQRGLRLDRAKAAQEAARARRQAAMVSASAGAVDAAVELERREARSSLAREALELTRELEAATVRRFAVGDVSELERNAATLERARAEARVAQAHAEAQAARVELNRRLGRPADAPLTVSLLATATDALPSELSGEQPTLVAARAEVEAAGSEVDLLRRERIPNPTLSLGYERERRPEAHGAFTDLHTEHLLIARLSVPLPLWDRNQGELAEARARHKARESERVSRTREVESEQTVARAMFDAARTAHTALMSVHPSVDRNLELVRRAYEAGQLGLDALLLARDRSFAASADAVDAAAALARARTALLRSVGRLPTGEVPE
ncbi:TolC family protein [Myxococcus qinghaiensis]|uniref:TolC family protein n=1 Tax=Myxococcus qinghaiensis TaxID=2906758 RepID=UPI0020A7EC83|nr:TolC family protein [Myxococcus qinghaiensis]MCP3164944.1 TolC family protein [Myxococcus qinghaiensis]